MITVTAPLGGTLSLKYTADPEILSGWPASLPKPVVTIAYADYAEHGFQTCINIDGETVKFWRWLGMENDIDDNHEHAARVWAPGEYRALDWGRAVHQRMENAFTAITTAVTVEPSVLAAAIAYATATGEAPRVTSEDAAVARGKAALAIFEGVPNRQQTLRNLLLDVRRTALAEGLDWDEAIAASMSSFEESGRPGPAC